ncbi:BnaC07g12040D [Brassica napus]|uniref:BnaC07g12040D protein n=1 Tax=Brassica napus TaxID=3708 RepID=A0A078G6F5_BRANA|nr:BnaC07g12040D [Brassica napus]
MFPTKISKAVFISAVMLANGQSTLDLFNQKLGSNDLMQQAQIFLALQRTLHWHRYP